MSDLTQLGRIVTRNYSELLSTAKKVKWAKLKVNLTT